jgi:hypothetical protein
MLADMSNRLTLPMRAADKWQEAAKAGFQLLPDLLLRHQADLGLTATDLVVLINLTMHWFLIPIRRRFAAAGCW